MSSNKKYLILSEFYNLEEEYLILYLKHPSVCSLWKVLWVNIPLFLWMKIFNLRRWKPHNTLRLMMNKLSKNLKYWTLNCKSVLELLTEKNNQSYNNWKRMGQRKIFKKERKRLKDNLQIQLMYLKKLLLSIHLLILMMIMEKKKNSMNLQGNK